MRHRTVTALLVPIAAAGVLAALWMATSERDPALARRSPAGAREEAPARETHPDPERDLAAVGRDAVVEGDAAAEEPEPSVSAGPARPAPQLVLLNGAAIRIDADGTEHAGDDGAFELTWRQGAELVRRRVEVLGGRWSVEVPPDAGLFASEVVLGGAPVTLEEEDLTVPADRYLLLRGRARQGVLLHVLSAGSRRELEQVEAWIGPPFAAWQHPGAEPSGEPVVAGRPSPILIPPRSGSWRGTSRYFVRAPDHAWGTIAIDHGAAGERTIVLQPAGALEVELIGSAEWLHPVVRLWPPDAGRHEAYAYAELAPDSEDRAVFEALAPGTYLASVERGWAQDRVSFGSATVEVVAGERLTLPITVALPERPETVSVSGSLTVPLSWDLDALKLVLGAEGETRQWAERPVGVGLPDMRAVAGAPDGCARFAWQVELPVPGSYRVEVQPLLVRRLLEVPAEGASGVAIVVPPPAQVEVTVLDADGGEEIPVESMQWSVPSVEGILATALYTAVADPDSGRVAFRAPAGEITVVPTDYSLRPVDEGESFHLVPGENRITLAVRRQIGVRFTFKDGDAVVPWDWSWRLGATQVEGPARDVARSIGTLWFEEEGTYELTSKGIPGYVSIDGTRFEVRAGRGLLDVEVSLVRADR